MERTLTHELYPALAGLLERPGEDLEARLDTACRLAAQVDIGAAERLYVMKQELLAMVPGKREELHTGTFELNPSCVLYISVHLFGEESFKRANLMTGLEEAYQAAGFLRGNELPDHLGVVLRFAPHFSDAEWKDLVQWVLVDSIRKMHETLVRGNNPYRYLLAAVRALVEIEAAKELADA